MVTYLQANTSLLTDYNEGSVVLTLLESNGMEFDKNYYQLELVQDASYIQQAQGEDLDLKAADYNLTRIQATYASGFITLSSNTPAPPAGIPIPANSTWSTQPAFTAYDAIAVQNPTAAQIAPGQLAVTIPVIAVVAGTTGNVLASQIIVNTSDVPGIDQVTNLLPLTGGANVESDTSLRSRLALLLKGTNAGTENSYVTVLRNNTTAILESVALVGPGEPLMTRDNGVGGKIDIYIEGNLNPQQFSEVFTYTGPMDYVFSPYIFDPPDYPNQRNVPVDSVVQLVDTTTSDVLVSPADYTFVPDTSIFGRSDRAQDMLVISNMPARVGHTFTVTFVADKTVGDLRTLIEAYRPVTADLMIKEGIEQLIDANIQPFYAPGVNEAAAQAAMQTVLQAYVDGLDLGQTLYVTEALRQMAEATVSGLKVVVGFNVGTQIFQHGSPSTALSIASPKNTYFVLNSVTWL
jgi:hypothetical protein